MDREQEEMQFLGFFGITKEAGKIIYSWRNIFAKITLSLILPLAFVFLAHIEVSNLIFSKIIRSEIELEYTRVGTPRYDKLSDLITSEWIYFWLFKAFYFTSLLMFSLLATAAVVYTIACIYTARDVTFGKVMSVVPRVWKRLMVTFLCIFAFVFVYNFVSFLVFVTWLVLIGPTTLGNVGFWVLLVFYFVGLVYLSVIWQLSSVVSVLEDLCGVKAMVKSRNLIKGNIRVALFLNFLLNLSFLAIQIAFQLLVVRGWKLGTASRAFYGTLSLLLLLSLFLLGLVIQTVIYFVCKSYHHENIDKSALSDHLEVYLGDYVPLKSKDIQLEHFEV